ncbi:Hypothetical predicted protein [Paramuricea clavata]|uniref:Uncharacterized protein n=1 Tax=Paramuricea clavata TaxID=317549 RepID=A0A7D9ILK3_PARCT|nr:Hypothetical predicted protein [Paramuricea clavata]
MEDIFDTKSLGVECSPRCGSCRCGRCPIGGKSFTLKEERELNLIEEGLTHEGNHWVARYPWIRSLDDLPNNKEAALGMLGSTEKRLQKNKPLLETYEEQIEDMVQRGVARKLTQAEIENYGGPVYYLSHHEANGPDLMNNLLGILVRFREGPVAFVGDIRKMYHAIKISVLDQHTHRFLWRDVSQDSGTSTYVMTSVSFGDKPARNVATVSLRKTAEMQRDDLPNASDTILSNTYVDEIADSVETMVTARETTGQIDDLVKVGGFQIKHWIYSSVNVNDDSANRSLGSNPKIKKLRIEPNLTEEQVSALIPPILTKRMVLSQINGIYDPLGLAAPFTVRAKILMRKLWIGESKDLTWDDPILASLREEWLRFFIELFNMEKVRFRRWVKPVGVVGNPALVMFSDGSDQAYGTCAYVRWQLENWTFAANLLAAKSRVTPIRKTTIVRTELNGALLSKGSVLLSKKNLGSSSRNNIFSWTRR